MPLSDLIRAEIERRGPLPFRDFMALALYAPGLGYYASGRAVIGKDGDFFTSVSVGALFGRLLARQFAELWERLGRPQPFTLVEQGAHRGHFAHDALTALRELAPECFAATEYRLVEPSAELAAAQVERLAPFAEKTHWHSDLAALPVFSGGHFSNELIDAFPVHLVKWTGSEWIERHVTGQDGQFVFVDGPLSSPALAARVAILPEVSEGYTTEINLAALDWLDAVTAKVKRGFILAIDYGYSREEFYRPERIEGTLSAYASHQREKNPLARPGEIDLTAHVEFTSLAERATERGFDVLGLPDQHHFMVGLSRLHFTDSAPVSAAAQKELRALQTLMHPALLGHSFKVLGLAKGVALAEPLSGFEFGTTKVTS